MTKKNPPRGLCRVPQLPCCLQSETWKVMETPTRWVPTAGEILGAVRIFCVEGISMDETLIWMGLKYVEPCWTYIYHKNKLNVGKYTIHGAFIRERFINHHKWLGQTTFVLQIPQKVHFCAAESPGLELIRAPKGLDDSGWFMMF